VIHGDSAGAGSVSFQLTAYDGRDDHLFVGGMAESPFWPTHRTVSEMELQFDRFAANVSCGNASDVLECLRSKDTATLQGSDVQSVFSGGNGTAEWYFLPVIDGNLSTDYLYNLYEQGKVVRVPVVVGDDTDEGTGFSPNASTEAEFLQFIKDNYPNLSEAQLQDVSQQYPENGFGSFPNHSFYFAATESAYGELTFTCPGIEISNSLATYNSPAQVWNYRYNVQDEANIAAGLGVPHVSEQPAIFGVNESAYKLCDDCSYVTYNSPIIPVLQSYWISFVVSLNPNTHKDPAAPVWETWTGSGASPLQRIKIQTNATEMEVVPQAQIDRCNFWKSLAEVTEQ
jgi:acetylcholinesterase